MSISMKRNHHHTLSRIATGIAACLLVVVLSGCFGQRPEAKTGDATETEAKTVLATITIDAPGWSKDSSPFVVHFTGLDDATAGVDFYHAVSAGDDASAQVELPAGSYEVGYISAINADGSIYRTPDEPATVVIGEADGESDDASEEQPTLDVDGSFGQVPAEDVTQDDIDGILGDLADAVEKGDETLSGDVGKDVVDTATGNAQNAPNVDKDKVEQAGDEASDAVKDEPTKPSTSGNGGSGSSSGNSGSSSKPSVGSSSSSSSNSSGGSTSASKPAHQHTWVAQTEQQWVVDEAAWDEPVYETRAVTKYIAECRYYKEDGSAGGCGASATFDNATDASNWMKDHLLAHRYDDEDHFTHYYSKTEYEYVQTGTVHHDEVGHWETVTTGYKCSGCGATQ